MSINNSQKSNIIMVGIVIGVLVLGVLVIFLAKPSALNQSTQASFSPSELTVDLKEYDFGTISMAKGRVSATFQVKNSSAQDVTIKKMYTSCMCTSATLIKGNERFGPFGMPGHGFIPNINQAIRAGEEAQIEVTFDPAAHGPSGVGAIARDVLVETSDGAKLLMEIRAVVTP